MNLTILNSFSGVFDRIDNLHIAGAHTKIAGQCFANFFFGWIGIARQEGMAGHNHSWRAVAALKSVIFDEGFLYRAQLTVFCQTLDCGYFAAICLDSKVETGFRQLVVQKNRAGAAFTDNAADMSPGETDILPQEMRQEQAGFDIFFEKSPINGNANRLFHNQVK